MSLSMILIVLVRTSIFAQSPPQTIALYPFTTSSSELPSDVAGVLTAKMSEVLTSHPKFSFQSIPSFRTVQYNHASLTEAVLGANNTFYPCLIPSACLEMARTRKITYLAYGIAQNVNYSSEQREKKEYDVNAKKMVVKGYYNVYTCTLQFSLFVINVPEMTLVMAENINAKNYVSSGGFLSAGTGPASSEAAYKEVLYFLQFDLRKAINKNFPYLFSVVEILDRNRRGTINEMKLGGDYSSELDKKQELFVHVIEESRVNGGTSITYRKIAEVKIIKINEDGSFAVKVKSGEDELTSAYDNNMKLVVTEFEY